LVLKKEREKERRSWKGNEEGKTPKY